MRQLSGTLARRLAAWPVAAAMFAILLLTVGSAGAGPVAGQSQQDGDASRGEELYAANCAMCHGADATGMMGMHPALTGVIDRLTREGVEVTIRNGRNTQPPMPAFAGELSHEEIADLVAYLDTLPPGPRNFGQEGMMGEDGTMDGMPGMMDEMMRSRGAGGALGWLLVAILAGLLLAVVVLAVTLARRQPAQPRQEPTAREVLDRRYAAGELSAEEYRQRRADLEA